MRIHRTAGKSRTIRSESGGSTPVSRAFTDRTVHLSRSIWNHTTIYATIHAPSQQTPSYAAISSLGQEFAQQKTKSPSKPSTASEWVRRNESRLRKYAGKWIAVTEKGVIANANDMEAEASQAKLQGFPNSMIFKMPKLDKLRFGTNAKAQ